MFSPLRYENDKYLNNLFLTPMQCTKCGFDNPDDAKFCQKCANVFLNDIQVSSEQNLHKQNNLGESQKPKKLKTIIAIMIGVLIIGGLSIAGYYYKNEIFNKTDNQDLFQKITASNDSGLENQILSVSELMEKELSRFNVNDDDLKPVFDFSSFKAEHEINPQMIKLDSPKDGYVISENRQYLEVNGNYDDTKNETGWSPYLAYISLDDADDILSKKENLLTSYSTPEELNRVIFHPLSSEVFNNDPGTVKIDTKQALSFDTPILVFQIENIQNSEIIARKIIHLSKNKKTELDLEYKNISIPELNIAYQMPGGFSQDALDQESRDFGIYHATTFKDSYSNTISIDFVNENTLSEIANINDRKIIEESGFDEATTKKMLEAYEQELKKVSIVEYLVTNNKIDFKLKSEFIPQHNTIRWKFFPINENPKENFVIIITLR